MKNHNPFVVYVLRLLASLSYRKNHNLMLVSNSPPHRYQYHQEHFEFDPSRLAPLFLP